MLINGLVANERRLALIEAYFCSCDAMPGLNVHERPIVTNQAAVIDRYGCDRWIDVIFWVCGGSECAQVL